MFSDSDVNTGPQNATRMPKNNCAFQIPLLATYSWAGGLNQSVRTKGNVRCSLSRWLALESHSYPDYKLIMKIMPGSSQVYVAEEYTGRPIYLALSEADRNLEPTHRHSEGLRDSQIAFVSRTSMSWSNAHLFRLGKPTRTRIDY